ncbi:MAG: Aspartate aminotransferase [Herminiimonas sp.]|nr:Aspartate aminotransferase [Herminiimonas sp.]
MLLNDSFGSAPLARQAVQDLGASRIREVANAGMGNPDVLAFWFGEPDEVTPGFIREAASIALSRGDTFYTQNFGIPALREAIAAYSTGLHQPLGADRVAVTSSGVSALMLLAQLIVNPGDRVVAVTPLWPNLLEIPRILGGHVEQVSLRLRSADSGHPAVWELDLQRLLDALTPGTKALFINSPNNPTGWVITASQQQILLAHCRKHGIWILSDDVYERLVYPDTDTVAEAAPASAIGAASARESEPVVNRDRRPAATKRALPCAPSFLDIADAQDRLVSANSFSKTWLMTGWRLGWVVAPAAVMPDLGKLLEYNTSCAPGFVQQAGIVALEQGEQVLEHTLLRYRAARDFLFDSLNAAPLREAGLVVPRPLGAMYLFFGITGEHDTLGLCKRLVSEAGLGLAPGSAFGPQGEGYIRWCFANSIDRLAAGVERLNGFFAEGGFTDKN